MKRLVLQEHVTTTLLHYRGDRRAAAFPFLPPWEAVDAAYDEDVDRTTVTVQRVERYYAESPLVVPDGAS